MKVIKIGEKEYTLEFTFEAAECKDLVQSMFIVISGAYIVKNSVGIGDDPDETSAASAMIGGASEMVADIPRICRIAFYAGLLEHHKMNEDEAKNLMKQYMVDNKISFYRLFEDMKRCMEDDGFFELSGLNDMIQKMNSAAEAQAEKVKEKVKEKAPAKKSTSTK